jgi:hypothetical protein
MEMIQLIQKNVPSFKACQNSWMAEAMARIKITNKISNTRPSGFDRISFTSTPSSTSRSATSMTTASSASRLLHLAEGSSDEDAFETALSDAEGSRNRRDELRDRGCKERRPAKPRFNITNENLDAVGLITKVAKSLKRKPTASGNRHKDEVKQHTKATTSNKDAASKKETRSKGFMFVSPPPLTAPTRPPNDLESEDSGPAKKNLKREYYLSKKVIDNKKHKNVLQQQKVAKYGLKAMKSFTAGEMAKAKAKRQHLDDLQIAAIAVVEREGDYQHHNGKWFQEVLDEKFDETYLVQLDQDEIESYVEEARRSLIDKLNAGEDTEEELCGGTMDEEDSSADAGAIEEDSD